jgi:hypothetical protein
MKTLAVLACVGLLAWVSEVSARTWYIKSDGTGDAATIQAGIDSAASGDTVLVALGIYHDCTHATPDGQTACVVMKSDVTLRS